MVLKVLHHGRSRRGTPVPDLIKIVHYAHPEVEFVEYKRGMAGGVILGINDIPTKADKDIRKVLYMGSLPSFMKALKKRHKNNPNFVKMAHHTIFISDFFKNIILSGFDMGEHSVFKIVGSLPSDDSMEPIKGSRKIDGPINFIAIAKWYKRKFKRLDQIENLYFNYLKKEYPDSILNVVGTIEEKENNGVHYYRKGFHDDRIVNIMRNSHIQIMASPFDTGPKTIPESLHYKVPFVCSNNCAGREYIETLGKCGIEVKNDLLINSYDMYRAYKPLSRPNFYGKQINYQGYFDSIKEIVENFEEYTSWEWNEQLNYKGQSDRLYNVLCGI